MCDDIAIYFRLFYILYENKFKNSLAATYKILIPTAVMHHN